MLVVVKEHSNGLLRSKSSLFVIGTKITYGLECKY